MLVLFPFDLSDENGFWENVAASGDLVRDWRLFL